MPEIHRALLHDISEYVEGVKIEVNFQQVLGMAKKNEINRLCIFMDAFNCDVHYNGERGQTVAEKIHKEAPNIPILIWDGREYISDEDTPPVFKVTGVPKPVTLDNELYLSFDHYDGILEITKQFFQGKLTAKDVPHRDCLDKKKELF